MSEQCHLFQSLRHRGLHHLPVLFATNTEVSAGSIMTRFSFATQSHKRFECFQTMGYGRNKTWHSMKAFYNFKENQYTIKLLKRS